MKALEIMEIPITDIRDFGGEYGKAYFSLSDEKVKELQESIAAFGILEPLIVRPDPTGAAAYELIAGKTRIIAAKNLGLETVPCLVQEYDGVDAISVYGETNRYRDGISIMKKAYMLRYKEEWGSKKSKSVVHDQNAIFDELEERTKRRYIRLTYLTPNMQHLVNVKRIRIEVGAAASYLTEDSQDAVYMALAGNSMILTTEAVQKLKEMYQNKKKPFGKSITIAEAYDIIQARQSQEADKVKIAIDKKIIEQLRQEVGNRKECEKFVEEILHDHLKK